MRELPVVNPTRCTACGDCVSLCPTACIEMSGTRPWLPRPRECIACGACALVCAADALKMESWKPA
jgi:NAD-dependent dihydropyrimidine dehydrogenase PreA subunit